MVGNKNCKNITKYYKLDRSESLFSIKCIKSARNSKQGKPMISEKNIFTSKVQKSQNTKIVQLLYELYDSNDVTKSWSVGYICARAYLR